MDTKYITQTGPNSWRVLIRLKVLERPIVETLSSREEAIQFRDDALKAIRRGQDPRTRAKRPGDAKVDALVDEYIKDRENSRRPIVPKRTEWYNLMHLKRDFEGVPVRELTVERFVRWARQRAEDGAGPATLKQEFDKLGTVLRHTSAAAYARAHDPVGMARTRLDHLGLIGDSDYRNRRASDEELERIMPFLLPIMQKVVRFAVATSFRRSEILRIQWKDIDQAARIVTLRNRKDPRRRVSEERVPLLPAAWAVVEELIREGVVQKGPVFPISPEGVSDAFLAARRLAGIDDLHFHDLRHEAISRLFEMGLDIPRVAMFSGHKKWETLKRYTHLSPEGVHHYVSTVSNSPASSRASSEAARFTSR